MSLVKKLKDKMVKQQKWEEKEDFRFKETEGNVIIEWKYRLEIRTK